MPEILTESFCERCGTRYTFESAAPRATSLRGIKTLTRGLKNFVLSDDTTMDEAMAAARSEAERDVTSQQLDAFHSTFNFCMSCRQYTCSNCWNEAEGQCLTCSPHLGREILPAPFPTLDAAHSHAVAATNGSPEPGVLDGPTEWPVMALDEAAPDVEAVAATEPVDEIDLGARLAALVPDPVAEEPREIAPVEAASSDEPAAAIDEPAAAIELTPAIEGLGPDQSLEEALAAFEQEHSAEAETAPAAEVEPVAAEVEPVAAEAPGVAAPPSDDRIDQPVWLPVAPDPVQGSAAEAPDGNGLAAAASAPPEPQWPSEPQWPNQPQWPSTRTATPRPNTILGRPTVPTGGIDALWAASSRDVLAPTQAGAPLLPGQPAPLAAQPCVNCGLSLSATARFCRRCGTAQAHA